MAEAAPLFQNLPSGPVVEITSALTLPKQIAEMAQSYPFDAAYLAKTLAIVYPDRLSGLEWFDYRGNAGVTYADGARIVTVDWRGRKTSTETSAFVIFDVQGTCFTKQQLETDFGELALAWHPNYRMPEKARRWGYVKAIEQGFITFHFSPDRACLTSFGFRRTLHNSEIPAIDMAKLRAKAYPKPLDPLP